MLAPTSCVVCFGREGARPYGEQSGKIKRFNEQQRKKFEKMFVICFSMCYYNDIIKADYSVFVIFYLRVNSFPSVW